MCSPGPSPSTRQVPGSSPGPAGVLRALFFSPPSLPPSGDRFFCTFPTKPTKVLGLLYTTGWVYYNPNTIKSYKILQKLSPKHAAHGVAQLPYPFYRHGKACLSKQPPWRAAPDPCLARGRSRVRAPGPAGALRVLFSSTLPSFLLRGKSSLCSMVLFQGEGSNMIWNSVWYNSFDCFSEKL